VREKISTTTALLVAHTAMNLKNFYVRRSAVILRGGWPPNLGWSDEVKNSIKEASRSYAATEATISSLIGYRWEMLSDKDFKSLKLATVF
jgi:F-box protein 39